MSKNLCNKVRDKSNPYEVWFNYSGWVWRVLRKYQSEEKEKENKYARWFCFVTSPLCTEGEYGDCYVADIISNAHQANELTILKKMFTTEGLSDD